MTREEYESNTEDCFVMEEDTRSEILDKFYEFEIATNSYVYHLEQRIKELEKQLEPKSCEGCKYDNSYWFNVCCGYCTRDKHSDYYEPKYNKHEETK